MEQIYGSVLLDYFRMKKKDLTAKQISSVRCPTCGVAARRGCVLLAGGLRSEPHLDRKLSAIAAVELNSQRRQSSRKRY